MNDIIMLIIDALSQAALYLLILIPWFRPFAIPVGTIFRALLINQYLEAS
jgi:hypothetical protein